MNINILTDNSNSWFVPYGKILQQKITDLGHKVDYVFSKNDLGRADLTFLLSCSRIVDRQFLDRSKRNVVIHASDLPKGKGFSPLQWQILEGKDSIVLTALEAADAVDAGPIYFKRVMRLNGTELYKELREKLAWTIIEMASYLVDNVDSLKPVKQEGEESFYPKRTNVDDMLDPNKSILEHFNHFRIADNENFPLYFYHKGEKFYLRIEKK